MNRLHLQLVGALVITVSTGLPGILRASEIPDNHQGFVLNYGVGKALELETGLKSLRVDKSVTIASGIHNRYQANLGVNWKPAEWFKLGPGVRYGWSERYGTRDSQLSSQRIQFTLDAVFRF